SAQSRQGLACADSRRARRKGLPHSVDARHCRVHGRTTPWHPQQIPEFPRRKPLGAEAAEQRAVARYGDWLVEAVDGPVSGPHFFLWPWTAGMPKMQEQFSAMAMDGRY